MDQSQDQEYHKGYHRVTAYVRISRKANSVGDKWIRGDKGKVEMVENCALAMVQQKTDGTITLEGYDPSLQPRKVEHDLKERLMIDPNIWIKKIHMGHTTSNVYHNHHYGSFASSDEVHRIGRKISPRSSPPHHNGGRERTPPQKIARKNGA